MLATNGLRRAQHEYLMILLSVAPDSAQAWRGLIVLHRRWAAENPAELGRQVKAYRLAIRNDAGMDERCCWGKAELRSIDRMRFA